MFYSDALLMSFHIELWTCCLHMIASEQAAAGFGVLCWKLMNFDVGSLLVLCASCWLCWRTTHKTNQSESKRNGNLGCRLTVTNMSEILFYYHPYHIYWCFGRGNGWKRKVSANELFSFCLMHKQCYLLSVFWVLTLWNPLDIKEASKLMCVFKVHS